MLKFIILKTQTRSVLRCEDGIKKVTCIILQLFIQSQSLNIFCSSIYIFQQEVRQLFYFKFYFKFKTKISFMENVESIVLLVKICVVI